MTDHKKVRVYGVRESPFSNRVEIALKLKGVEYEHVDEDLLNKSSDLLRYNPIHKKIPVLVHGDRAISESHVILEYIDETWSSGPSILPPDPYKRALARFWARFLDDKLIQSIHKFFFIGEEQALEEVVENLKIIDTELTDKRFFGGETIGFVDIVANFLGYFILAVEEATEKTIVTHEAFPSICKWRDEFEEFSVVKEILPQREKLVVLVRARLELLRSQTSK